MRKEMVWVPFDESIIGIGKEERIYKLHKDRDTDKNVSLSFLIITENGKIGTPNQVLAYELYKNNQYSIYSIGKIILNDKILGEDMYITIIRNDKIRGVNKLKFNVTFSEYVEIIDYGPKTEWVKDPNKNIEIGGEQLTIPIKPIINIPINIPIKFHYKWNKKIGRVISGRYGNGAWFEFNKIDEYLDGERPLYFIIRVPKDKTLDKIIISNIEVNYDKPLIKDKKEQIDKKIEVQVQTSSV